jgi:hypothetical protein
MNFLIFLWNSFVRIFSFFAFIVFEIIVFYWIVSAISSGGMPILAGFLAIVFTIWILAEIIIRIFIGGGKNLIKWIFRF